MAVREGDPWPKPRPEVVRAGQQMLLGPTGEQAAVVDWHRFIAYEHRPGIVQALRARLREQGVKGDPSAGPLPRSWKTGVGLAGPKALMDAWSQAYPGNIKQGLAYFSPEDPRNPDELEGHWVAGALPEGRTFGTAKYRGSTYRTVVARAGKKAPIVSPVLIRTDEAELIFPFAEGRGSFTYPDQLIAVGGLALSGLRQNPDFSNAPVV